MATVDILCVIDADTLATAVANHTLNPGTVDSPTALGSYNSSDTYIFMIADGQYVVNNQAKSELSISCNVNDTIRWTISNPSAGVDYNCMLYNFESGGIGTYITQPIVTTVAATSYYNNPLNVNTPDPTAYMLSAWTCNALEATNPASVQYNWSFQLINTSNGLVIGYFYWDPFIQINAQ